MGKVLQSLGGTRQSQLIEGWKSTKWKKQKSQNSVINEGKSKKTRARPKGN